MNLPGLGSVTFVTIGDVFWFYLCRINNKIKHMKYALFSLMLVLTGLFSACGTGGGAVKTISLAEFKKLQAEPNTEILDVRTPGEIAEGVISGATLFLDYQSADFETQLESLDKEKTYLVYCRSGNRSGKAAAMMEGKGFKKIYNLDGGVSGWSDPLISK